MIASQIVAPRSQARTPLLGTALKSCADFVFLWLAYGLPELVFQNVPFFQRVSFYLGVSCVRRVSYVSSVLCYFIMFLRVFFEFA